MCLGEYLNNADCPPPPFPTGGLEHFDYVVLVVLDRANALGCRAARQINTEINQFPASN